MNNNVLYDLIVIKGFCIYTVLNNLIDIYGPDSRIYREDVCMMLNRHKQKPYQTKEEFDSDYSKIIHSGRNSK